MHIKSGQEDHTYHWGAQFPSCHADPLCAGNVKNPRRLYLFLQHSKNLYLVILHFQRIIDKCLCKQKIIF